MNKQVFIAELYHRCDTKALTYRKVEENGTRCWLYYNEGTHVGTWISKKRFFFLGVAKNV